MGNFTECDREAALSALKADLETKLEEAALAVDALMALKDSPAAKVCLDAVPQVGALLKPWIQDASDFFTALDIAAIRKMEAAGITQENAVALQRSSIIYALLPALGKEAARRKTQGK